MVGWLPSPPALKGGSIARFEGIYLDPNLFGLPDRRKTRFTTQDRKLNVSFNLQQDLTSRLQSRRGEALVYRS